MVRPRNNVAPCGRDYRRSRRLARLADPRFYLSAVLVSAGLGLIVLPAASDAVFAAVKPIAEPDGACRIYQVIDGDTVRMFCPGRGNVKARLTGFDTPELFSPSCASELLAATGAQWALRRALWSADKVTLVREGTDRYGRALVAVFLDGAPLAARMIEGGYARSYGGGQREGWCA